MELLPFFLFLIGLVMLLVGAEVVIDNSKKIAFRFDISEIIIGITVVALGTSFPELIVSIFAIFDRQHDIVIGNIVGSNIANIGLVLGVTSILSPILLNSKNKEVNYNLLILFIATISLIFGLIFNVANSVFGAALLFLLFLYIYILFKYFLNNNDKENQVKDKDRLSRILFFIIMGFLLVSFGSEFFIKGVIGISERLGFSNNLIISMTLVALGTSLPELVTTLSALRKNESNMALGNVIGSNIINILLVIGSCAILGKNLFFNLEQIMPHLIVLFIATVSLIFVCIFLKKINKILGIYFVILYTIFIYINFN